MPSERGRSWSNGGRSHRACERLQVLFAPLTGIEMRRSRIDGATIIAEMALTVNLTTPTIEQVMQKRMLLVQQMSTSLAMESRAKLSGTGIEEACAALLEIETRARILRHPATWFNDDENFLLSVDQVLAPRLLLSSSHAHTRTSTFSRVPLSPMPWHTRTRSHALQKVRTHGRSPLCGFWLAPVVVTRSRTPGSQALSRRT